MSLACRRCAEEEEEERIGSKQLIQDAMHIASTSTVSHLSCPVYLVFCSNSPMHKTRARDYPHHHHDLSPYNVDTSSPLSCVLMLVLVLECSAASTAVAPLGSGSVRAGVCGRYGRGGTGRARV